MTTKNILIGAIIILAVIAILLVYPGSAHGEFVSTPKFTGIESPVESKNISFIFVEKKHLTPAQVIWLAKLMNCESGIKAHAVNPNDLDNTPSWGILQFKESTFAAFTVKYGIEGDIMDGESQVKIVTEWLIRENEVDWTVQFPACVAKLGLPPVQ